MGVGKSAVGRALSQRLSVAYRDLDQEIETRHGPIPSLFKRGEAYFRQLEYETLQQLLGEAEAGVACVISLGGGVLTYEPSCHLLASRARWHKVWLDAPVWLLWQRVQGSDRPLAANYARFRLMAVERRSLYRAFGHRVLAYPGSPAYVSQRVMDRLG